MAAQGIRHSFTQHMRLQRLLLKEQQSYNPEDHELVPTDDENKTLLFTLLCGAGASIGSGGAVTAGLAVAASAGATGAAMI